jgi:hypothetical protein
MKALAKFVLFQENIKEELYVFVDQSLGLRPSLIELTPKICFS